MPPPGPVLPGTTVPENGRIVTMSEQNTAALWVERTGTRAYTGRNERGAEVRVASAGTPAAFTPGELLKIAVAACSGLSADFSLSRKLGEHFDATIRVSGDPDRENEVYPEIDEVFELDLSELSEGERERLLVSVQRAVDRVCTVGRTLKSGSKVTLSFDVEL